MPSEPVSVFHDPVAPHHTAARLPCSQRCGAAQVTKAIGDTQLVISGSTAVLLAIGRFAAMPYQRRISEQQVPQQNGEPHMLAGDGCAPGALSLFPHCPARLAISPCPSAFVLALD